MKIGSLKLKIESYFKGGCFSRQTAENPLSRPLSGGERRKDYFPSLGRGIKGEGKRAIQNCLNFNPLLGRGRLKSVRGFTLAEVLIAITVIGVISAITVPVLTAQYKEQETVSKVKKMYSVISQAVREYQFENACTEKIADCFAAGEHWTNTKFHEKLTEHLNIIHTVKPGDNRNSLNWLPRNAKHLNGNTNTTTWMGVHDKGIGLYGLADGSVLNFIIPDDYKQSGYVFFDTNGVKGPNRIGKDQFPIGIGAYKNDKFASSVHPYFNEDGCGQTHGGLCCISNGKECSADVCTKDNCSPTAYILKYSKLPPL